MIVLKLLISLGLLSLLVIFNIITMIYGWGLEPKSWLVIIGIGFFGLFIIIVGNILLNLIAD